MLASGYVLSATLATTVGLVIFAVDVFSGKAASGASNYQVSGPVGVIQKASAVVATRDWNMLLRYAAMLSVNLAVLNLVPIPPSDGFQICYILIKTVLPELNV